MTLLIACVNYILEISVPYFSSCKETVKGDAAVCRKRSNRSNIEY